MAPVGQYDQPAGLTQTTGKKGWRLVRNINIHHPQYALRATNSLKQQKTTISEVRHDRQVQKITIWKVLPGFGRFAEARTNDSAGHDEQKPVATWHRFDGSRPRHNSVIL